MDAIRSPEKLSEFLPDYVASHPNHFGWGEGKKGKVIPVLAMKALRIARG
jgi:hypothetical protein